MITTIVHCRHAPYDIYIGRPSKWGNPFSIGVDGTREEVIEKYAGWIIEQPHLLNDLHELEGKVLGCWCKPEACHGDILIRLIKEGKDLIFVKNTLAEPIWKNTPPVIVVRALLR